MKEIIQQPHATLRKIAEPVIISGIPQKEIQTILKDMFDALATQKDGIALAAPQINISKRIFVISPEINRDGLNIPLVYINPEIISKSKDKKSMEEGCLSCRWWYGKTKRASRVHIKAHSEDGAEFTFDGSGLVAQIFQHEIDHLEGILFIDHAKNLKESEPEY
jgi:peptide deformylase